MIADKMSVQVFIEEIFSLLKRPSLHKVESVEDIWVFVRGYEACYLKVAGSTELTDFLSAFDDYCIKHFGHSDAYKWFKTIRFYSGSNWHSLQLFEKLFTEFLESRNPD